MRKLACFFSLFLCLWWVYFDNLHVCATSPVLSNSFFDDVYNANAAYAAVEFTQYGVFPEISVVPAFTNYFSGSDPFIVTSNDCEIHKLSKFEMKDLIRKGFTEFYDTNGDSVSLDTVYMVNYQSRYFDGIVYVDSYGNVCSYDRGLAIALRLSDLGKTDFSAAVNAIATNAINNNNNYSPTGSNIAANGYYVMFGRTLGGQPSDVWSMYISNQYNPGVIVPVQTNNGQLINKWYCNNIHAFRYAHDWGNTGYDVLQITEGYYSRDGINYRFQITFANGWSFMDGVNGSYEDFISGRNTFLQIAHGRAYSANFIQTIPFTALDGDPDLLGDDYIPYPDIDDVPGTINGTIPIPNPAYDPDHPITGDNVPVVTPIPDDIIISTPNPFPDPDPEPGEDDDPETIDPGIIGLDLPILNNLQYRFPFCIPFDLYKLFSGLEVERQTPAIDTVISFGEYYDWHVQYDLHAFDDTAALFRKLFLVVFLIGLALFSYDHFFGK